MNPEKPPGCSNTSSGDSTRSSTIELMHATPPVRGGTTSLGNNLSAPEKQTQAKLEGGNGITSEFHQKSANSFNEGEFLTNTDTKIHLKAKKS